MTGQTTLDCTHDESRVYTCTICNEEKIDVIKKCSGHNVTDLVNVLPTCTKDGKKEYNCSLCNEHIVEIIPKTGHSFQPENADEGDCQTLGHCDYICSVCGEKYTETFSTYGSHCLTKNEYGNIVCSICGETIKKYVDEFTVSEENSVQTDIEFNENKYENKYIMYGILAVIISFAAALVIKLLVFGKPEYITVDEPLSDKVIATTEETTEDTYNETTEVAESDKNKE